MRSVYSVLSHLQVHYFYSHLFWWWSWWRLSYRFYHLLCLHTRTHTHARTRTHTHRNEDLQINTNMAFCVWSLHETILISIFFWNVTHLDLTISISYYCCNVTLTSITLYIHIYIYIYIYKILLAWFPKDGITYCFIYIYGRMSNMYKTHTHTVLIQYMWYFDITLLTIKCICIYTFIDV